MKRIFLFLIIIACLGSCATRKDVVYLQGVDDAYLNEIDSLYHHPKIQVNDILKIDLTALEEESTLPFKFDKMASNQGSAALDRLKLEGFLVTKAGNINYPGLGKLKVKGKTTQEVQDMLEERLSKYIKDPSVKVRLVNFKITIMGEVKNPGTYTISEETMTIPQALGMAGDLNIQGKRNNVLLIREVDGKRQSYRLDLTGPEWITSPYYFVRQNDIVYVEPNNPRVKSAGFVGNLGTLISVVSILLSAAVIIFR